MVLAVRAKSFLCLSLTLISSARSIELWYRTFGKLRRPLHGLFISSTRSAIMPAR